MAADTLTPAILQYVTNNAYPDSEAVYSANLGADALSNILAELHKAQDEVKNEIRSLSKNAAPDIDTWITRAKELQTDIQRSRETARQIVAEHEAGRDLRAKVEDTSNKVRLLEREVAFEETLSGTLEHIAHANGVLDGVQEEAVRGNIKEALEKWEEAESSIAALDGLRDTKACGLLEQRAKQLKEDLCETATECWNALVQVDAEGRSVKIEQYLSADTPDAAIPEIRMEVVLTAVQGLGLQDNLLHKLSKDIERAILRPRLVVDDEQQVAKVEVLGDQLSCSGRHDDTSFASLVRDLEQMIDFLATRLAESIAIPLSDLLIPALSHRLEEHWLEPAIPLGVSEMLAFQGTLDRVQKLVETIDRHKWHGGKQLRDWAQNAPRTWLTKRREAVLGDVRNLVFAGLRETKMVERVETQMISKNDHQALGGGGGDGDDDWDTAWDEPDEEVKSVKSQPTQHPAVPEEDEGSAWDTDDLAEKPPGDDEGEAWGWGDDEGSQQPPSPVATKKQQPAAPAEFNGKPSEREMTLRETFAVTAVPDGILGIIQQIISDAQTLAGREYSSSPIAPAATALYTLPTLCLAIYRATAPTAYATLPTGNMLIYNDASHLSSKLRDWQALQPPASRLRLDNDVKALETFARRAYSSEMESQRTILRDLLDGAQGFSNSTKQPFKQECESAVEQTVDRLREVQGQWKGILSDGALLQSLGSLLATVTGKMVTELEDLGDIGEEDSHQLRKLMDKISEAKDIFVQQREGAEPAEMTFIYCPNWLKFQYLAEILESSLADIKYLWNEGELSLEFDAEEVVELIEGLFAESEVRRRTIGEIRRGGKR